MKSVDILIIDYAHSGLARYAVPISKHIKSIESKLVVGACYISDDKSESFAIFDEEFCVSLYNYKASEILKVYKPKAIIVLAHRIFDYMFTIEAHKMGIFVFNFQHGLYSDDKITSSVSSSTMLGLIKKKKEKIFEYSKCVMNICHKNLYMLLKICLMIFCGANIYKTMNEMFGEVSNADVSFTYGNYWNNYYRNCFLEMKSEYIVVGYPELESDSCIVGKDLFEDATKPTICYLAPVSVEDGFVKKSKFEDFLAQLRELLPNFNLILKLHPRSDISLYSALLEKNLTGSVYVWNSSEFPRTDYYVGDESTVVAKALYITPKTLICRISEERISPFEKYSRFVAKSPLMLNSVMGDMVKDISDKTCEDISDYMFYNKDKGAIAQTANEIVLNLHKRQFKEENNNG